MLAASDAALGAFGLVMATLITAAAGIIAKRLDRADAKIGEPGLGLPEGHGSLSAAVGHIATQQAVMMTRLATNETAASTIVARLDNQDAATAHDRREREAGQARQQMISERQEQILDAVAEIRATQATFVTRDEFAPIAAALDRLNVLIGDPRPDWDPTPVLPYVHEAIHDLRSELARVGLASSTLSTQVIALNRQVAALSAVLDVPAVEPDLSDDLDPEEEPHDPARP